jgi:hypothetical protein
MFRLQPRGFTNRDLRPLIAQLRGLPAEQITVGQMTYDLRRLRHHGLIERIPHSHRYQVTDTGLTTAHFLTAVHDRLLPTGLAQLTDPRNRPLKAANKAYNLALDNLATTTRVAA